MAKADVLKQIVQRKKERVAEAKLVHSQEQLQEMIQGMPPCRPFAAAISKPRVLSLIAEIKKASPSAGVIRQDFDPAAIAREYQEIGVQAISVLTEEDFFQGSLLYLGEVKAVVQVPVLRKDFILEPYQVYESRAYGADAVLFIADLLTKDALTEMMALADSLGLQYIVEVHEEKELKKVLTLKAPVIGINNRDLRTLEVDLKTTERLYTLIPRDKVVVVESGLKTRQDTLFLKVLGVHAILVGETFMAAPSLRPAVEGLMGW
jgi:indole-3-glycerol phosphate synthase